MSDDFRQKMIELLPRMRRFALSLTGDLDQADDLVQEACMRALSSASQWQPGTRLDSWMYRITQNVWFDRLRARKVRGEVVDIDDNAHLTGSDGRDIVESRSTLAVVSEKISNLPKDQQLLIALICVDGLSYKEAAVSLGVPIGTVMSRLARARASLNDAMQQQSPLENTAPGGKRNV
ncbi:MAG: RNA polymerase sigma factor [Hyphomicrobiaceae bacterium]